MELKNHLNNNIISRLSRIEGQIRGIKEMGASGRSCSDILTQLSAVHNAVTQVSKLIMLDHIENCVKEGIREGDVAGTVEDLTAIINQFSKMR